MSLSAGDVMTADEVAELLRVSRSTVYELARSGELPSSRLGRSVRFLRPRIEAWLAGEGFPADPGGNPGVTPRVSPNGGERER